MTDPNTTIPPAARPCGSPRPAARNWTPGSISPWARLTSSRRHGTRSGCSEGRRVGPFAERFLREGFAVVAMDYRQWGGSSGWPRDELSVPRQRQDYSTVIGWAAAHPKIDAQRLFAWGTSFAGMHVTALAASDSRLAGAVAQCPLVEASRGQR